MTKGNYYLTTTLPYVNAAPHIGFALEILQADTIARYHTAIGDSVFFNFGTDEHGLKIYQKALEEGKTPKEYCDEYAKKFEALKSALNLSYNNFIRTTDEHHILAAQEFWRRCDKNGDIYKKSYKAKYCVGCELEKTDSELNEGRCPVHPNMELELIEEENYFFKFSKYQDALLTLYSENPSFVVPEHKFNEIKEFVKSGLQDFSISRLKEKMPWGIDVPGDPNHVMFVWFDALVNYISAIGWPNDMGKFDKWWPVVQFAGKDNLRQQTAIWQAMLMSAGIPNSREIFIHGFVTANGQKISKSLGNVINPIEVVEKYGTDPLRYFILAKMNPFDDSDFTFERFELAYNSDLANGLGNLVSRVAKLAEGLVFSPDQKRSIGPKVAERLDAFNFSQALEEIFAQVGEGDVLVSTTEPWKEDGEKRLALLRKPVELIRQIAVDLAPFLPETAETIRTRFEGSSIVAFPPLFPRLPVKSV